MCQEVTHPISELPQDYDTDMPCIGYHRERFAPSGSALIVFKDGIEHA